MKYSLRFVSIMASMLLVLSLLTAPALAGKAPRPSPPPPSPSADLSVSVSDSADPVMLGQAVTYVIAVSNAGPDGASPRVRMTLKGVQKTFVTTSSGSCSQNSWWKPSTFESGEECQLGSLPKGSTARVTVETVALSLQASASLRAEIPCCPQPPDPALANNAETEWTTVTRTPETPPITGPGPLAGGCGSFVLTVSRCSFVSTGGPINVAGAFISEPLRPACGFPYCPILGPGEFASISVGVSDPSGRWIATCSAAAACAAKSSETVPAGTVLTCSASVWYWFPTIPLAGAFACTG